MLLSYVRRIVPDSSGLDPDGSELNIAPCSKPLAELPPAKVALQRVSFDPDLFGDEGEKPYPGSCPICLVQWSESDRILLTACAHAYHDQCIHRWLDKSTTCALCRFPLDAVTSSLAWADPEVFGQRCWNQQPRHAAEQRQQRPEWTAHHWNVVASSGMRGHQRQFDQRILASHVPIRHL